MVAWRAAGINYVRYSQIASEVVGKCLKGVKDTKRGAQTLKMTVWVDGKAVPKAKQAADKA